MVRIGLIFSLLLFILSNSPTSYSYKIDELAMISQIMIENNLQIEEWNVVFKEDISREKAKKLVEQTKNESKVTVTKKDKTTIYSWGNISIKNSISEQYHVIIPHAKQGSVKLNIELKGNIWNQSVKEIYDKKVEELSKETFTNNVRKFTCIQTANSDIIEHVDFFMEFEKHLVFQEVSTQKDVLENKKYNKVYYGYTPLWDEKINIMGQNVNFQMVIQEDENEKTKLIVGTPILVNEY